MVMGEFTQETELLVIGGGPGGYAAAFRAADLGMEVIMVDMEPRPGGECLFRGCIPSKTLLHLADLIHDARGAKSMGITFNDPKIDLDAIRAWKEKVIDTLADGLVTMSNKRGVQLVQGRAVFEGSDRVRLHDSDISHVKFKHAILATGSQPSPLPGITIKEGGRVMDSTGALGLIDIPESLFIYGGGYIGDRLLRGADTDLVKPLIRRLEGMFESIHFNTTIASLKEHKNKVDIALQGEVDKPQQSFERVLIAVGRQANTQDIGLETTNVKLDEKGFVAIDEQQRTSDDRIFAIGDVAGGPLLAHKAIKEGKVAAEVLAGEPSAFDARAIPAVVYTDPQVAWCGLTEEEARKQNRPVKVERFPWKFSGRAITMGATDGLTKLVVDPETGRILGLGLAGRDVEGRDPGRGC
jgi:dihydrolipoamide dehydrogenase